MIHGGQILVQMKQINIKEYFKQEVEKLRADRSIVPSLMIIDATTRDPANQIYIRNKIKDFEYYPDVIPCEGASGQCIIECRMRGCKYE